MIVEKIEKLKNKNYKIEEVNITIIFSDTESRTGLVYFSKPVYKEKEGFSINYPTKIEEKPSKSITNVASTIKILFSIKQNKLNNINLISKPRELLKQVTKDFIDLLEINFNKQNYKTYAYYSRAILCSPKHHTNYTIVITIEIGYKNFNNIIKNNTKPIITGSVSITKSKPIISYL